MCGASERKKIQRIQNINMYTWYSHYKWSGSPLKFKIQDLHDLFLETLFWINLCLVKN